MGGKPLPDGVDPDKVTWVDKPGYGSQGGYYEHDETGQRYVPDPSKEGHWPHWDLQDEDGRPQGRYPKKSLKPWPGQKRAPYGDQSATDPWMPAQSVPLGTRIWRWIFGSPPSPETDRPGAPVYVPGFLMPAPGMIVPSFGVPGMAPALIPALVP